MAQATGEGPEEYRVVGHDKFDDLTWRQTLGECPALRDLRSRGREVHPGFGGLLADLHSGLYKPDPRLVPEAELPPRAGWQRAAVERCWQSKEWTQSREASVLDEVLSALGALAAGEAALDELNKHAGEQPPPPPAPSTGGGEGAHRL